MSSKVYRIVSLDTGKAYIGISRLSLIRRWQGHVWVAMRGKSKCALHAAIRKYGQDRFQMELIEVAGTRETAQHVERTLIRSLNTLAPIGYNLTSGGDGGDTMTGRKASEETRMRMRLAQLGKKKPQEEVERMRARLTGRKLSEAHAAKIRLIGKFNKGKRRTERDRLAGQIRRRTEALARGETTGVQPDRHKWSVRIKRNDVRQRLGSFDTFEEARAVYVAACEAHLAVLQAQYALPSPNEQLSHP